MAQPQTRNVLLAISIDSVGIGRLPELLVQAGCEVTLLRPPGLAINSTRWVKTRVRGPYGPKLLRGILEEHVAANPQAYCWVIIGDEPLLRTFLSKPAEPALASLIPMLSDSAKLNQMLSKVRFSLLAAEMGVPVPKFTVLPDRPAFEVLAWQGRPIVLKAEESLSGSGVHVIADSEALDCAKQNLNTFPMLLQDFLEGPVGATSVLYRHGEPQCWFSYFLRRNWPHARASASALELFWHPSIEPILNSIGRMTAFHGLCGLDWMLNEKGNPLVLELNPRPIPGASVGRRAGVSFPQAIAHWLDGEQSVHRPSPDAQAFCRLFPQNLFRAIDDRDPGEFFRTWADAPWRDPGLLFSQSRRVLTHYGPASLRARIKKLLRRPAPVSQF